MKILAHGIIPDSSWKKELYCTGSGNSSTRSCGAFLEVEKSDLRYYPGVSGDSWGSRDPAVCFKCPECGSITDLNKAFWPLDSYTELAKWSQDWYVGENNANSNS